jgi:hypothetical protein
MQIACIPAEYPRLFGLVLIVTLTITRELVYPDYQIVVNRPVTGELWNTD